MKKSLLSLAVVLSLLTTAFVPVNSQAPSQPPRRRLALQFGGSANVFVTTNPDPDGTPLTLTSATGITPADGLSIFSIGAGFTAPVTFTALYWQQDNVTTSKSRWTRLGPAATGSNTYSIVVDAHYTSFSFVGPPNTPILVLASGAVTGDVYTNTRAHSSNPGSTATGY